MEPDVGASGEELLWGDGAAEAVDDLAETEALVNRLLIIFWMPMALSHDRSGDEFQSRGAAFGGADPGSVESVADRQWRHPATMGVFGSGHATTVTAPGSGEGIQCLAKALQGT